MRIYLDNCCFNRPYDDKSILTNNLEAQAKLFVQNEILQGTFELVWSYMMDYENSMNRNDERRNTIAKWKTIAKLDIDFSEEINEAGRHLMKIGLKNKDALHIACAVDGGCDFFLTTDKGILNKHIKGITVLNPINFVMILEE